jgi:hypothetical protein
VDRGGRTEADRYCAFAESLALLQNLQRTDEIHRVTVARMLGMDDPRDRMTEAIAMSRVLQESDARYAEMNTRIHSTPLAPGMPPCKRVCAMRDRPFE